MIALQKEDFILWLRDPDVSREIFEIVKRGGIPLPLDAPIGNTALVNSAPPAQQSAPTAKITSSNERERILALRQKMWQAVNEKKSAQATNSPEQNMETVKQSITPKISETIRQRLQQNFAKSIEEAKLTDKFSASVAEVETEPKLDFSEKINFLREQAKKMAEEKAALEAAKAAETPEHIATEKYSFTIERPCPICEKNTRVVHVKSRLMTEKQDIDLCMHYQDFNPYLYTVWACEHCGFAAEDTKFRGHIPQRTRDKIHAFLHTNNLVMPFIEERTTEDALSFYEIAILFSEIFDPSPGRQAALYQKMAWCCRYDEPDTDREKEFLRKAATLYEQSLETERYPIGKLSDDTAMYITSAIYFMLEDYDKAVKQLSRIIGDQKLRSTAPKMFEKARDMWQEIKRMRSVQEKNEELASAVLKRANS